METEENFGKFLQVVIAEIEDTILTKILKGFCFRQYYAGVVVI